ncbi:hypothetical protein FDT66_03165 [Polaribacter aestuariivivens]|uniref:DUF4097 domain-containing protein n=1 Tax=Polaribacter aestuariivivens TaxID=2304626 RepID=A0A5S3NET2_9FLAO|nr:hypothetical protein [Polaribacter aestuariivivens]TMM32479.1 hypothetical protein FDT66_03165 [Polaribacter aestuariivivens]
MKSNFLLLFLSISSILCAQKEVIEKFQATSNRIEIYTTGLDDFVIENSNSDFVEVYLVAENSNKQHIVHKEKFNTLQIKFNIPEVLEKEIIFRKFITKRLQRARAIIKIPNHKKVVVFGEDIYIESKSLASELDIFIENGVLKLNTVQANTNIKLYSGTVSANLKNTNINLVSDTGNLTINDKNYFEKYKKRGAKNLINFNVNSKKANIVLTTKITQ